MTEKDGPIARVGEIPNGKTKRIERAGEAILLCNAGGTLYAIEDACSHDGAEFEAVDVEDCRIMCPRHGALFDVTTGEALTLPAFLPVRTYALRVVGEDVFIEG